MQKGNMDAYLNVATSLGWRVIRCQPKNETSAETLRLVSAAIAANLSLP